MITVSTAFRTELEKGTRATPVYLFDFDMSTGHRRIAQWWRDVVYNGDTYTAFGPIVDFAPSASDQNTPLGEESVIFEVQNDPSLLADLFQNCRQRFYTRYLVMLGADGLPVNDEAIELSYRHMIPGVGTADGDKYQVKLDTESRFHEGRNRAPRTYSNSWQLDRDPTDFSLRDSGKQLNIAHPGWRQRSGLGY